MKQHIPKTYLNIYCELKKEYRKKEYIYKGYTPLIEMYCAIEIEKTKIFDYQDYKLTVFNCEDISHIFDSFGVTRIDMFDYINNKYKIREEDKKKLSEKMNNFLKYYNIKCLKVDKYTINKNV